MLETKKGFILEIVYFIILIFFTKLFPLINHEGIGILILFFLYLPLGLILWFRNFKSMPDNTTKPIVVINFLNAVMLKVLILVGACFKIGNYPGLDLIMLLAILLVWSYFISCLVIKKYRKGIISFIVLKFIILIIYW
jgi:hypothetical protein